jgi:hypothetical protein
MLVGLAAVHVSLAGVYLPPALTSLNRPLVRHVLLVSVLCVEAIYVFMRISLASS